MCCWVRLPFPRISLQCWIALPFGWSLVSALGFWLSTCSIFRVTLRHFAHCAVHISSHCCPLCTATIFTASTCVLATHRRREVAWPVVLVSSLRFRASVSEKRGAKQRMEERTIPPQEHGRSFLLEVISLTMTQLTITCLVSPTWHPLTHMSIVTPSKNGFAQIVEFRPIAKRFGKSTFYWLPFVDRRARRSKSLPQPCIVKVDLGETCSRR